MALARANRSALPTTSARIGRRLHLHAHHYSRNQGSKLWFYSILFEYYIFIIIWISVIAPIFHSCNTLSFELNWKVHFFNPRRNYVRALFASNIHKEGQIEIFLNVFLLKAFRRPKKLFLTFTSDMTFPGWYLMYSIFTCYTMLAVREDQE